MSQPRAFLTLLASAFLSVVLLTGPAAAVESSLTLDDGIRVISDDGVTEFRFGGRIHLDWLQINDDVTNFDDGLEIRRLRPYVRIRHKDLTFQVAGDVESEVSGIKDLWIRYDFSPRIYIRAGNMVPPFGMEAVSSSNYNTFADRALPHLFTSGFGLGAEVAYIGDNWTVRAGWFDQPLESLSNERERHGNGGAARVTWDPYRKGPVLIHLGASAEIRDIPTDGQFRLRTKPEIRSTDVRLIDTRTIDDVSSFKNFGLEAAARFGPFTLQGEYMHSKVKRTDPFDPSLTSLNFDGYYVQATYVLTGERRLYRSSTATFTGVEPESKFGALELALRYSSADLTNEDITGGIEDNISLGINWYLSRKTRFMFNYIAADATPNRDGIDEKPDIFVLRWQTFF